ncbi:MAG TPA: 50S ribosomal protein L28 [Candidatus Magasanikbacteria bacterium]|nr:50S ribosomal protein L28 [Candidatus Magasanikbacteria bacterium]
MSKVCDLCGRGPMRANNVSHAKNRTNRRQYVNLQSTKIADVATKVCTRCKRTLAKHAA